MHKRKDNLMRTEADLMAAFGALEQQAPDPAPVLRAIQAATRLGRPPRRRRPARRPALGGIAIAAVCAGTAAAVMLALLPGAQATHRRTITAGHAPRPARQQPAFRSASQVLLLAAAHVSASAGSGRYWQVRTVQVSVVPAGTKAHPYDIASENPMTVWVSRTPGRLSWGLSDATVTDHAAPLSPADQAAWRAAGSPPSWYPDSSWHGLFDDRIGQVPLSYHWQSSDGVVGYVESNLKGLTAPQFARLPGSVSGLRRYLFAVAHSISATKGSPEFADDLVWSEALNLLVDPVSAQVRAAAYRVMAGLPEVQLLGPVTDQFGRQGYSVRMKRLSTYAGSGVDAVIDPATGALLDTRLRINPSDIVGANYGSQVCHGNLVPKNLSPQAWVQWTQNPANRNLSMAEINRRIKQYCPFVVQYYGRPYSGLEDTYTGFFGAGWVNALPHVPPATQANQGPVTFAGTP